MYKFRILLYYRVFWYILLNNKIKTICVNNCAYKCVVLCWGCSVSGYCVCSVFSVSCVCAYCVRSVCVLCADCFVVVSVHIYVCRCMCVYCVSVYVYCVRMCVWYSVEVVFNHNPIPPLYGCLCGYMVRIIKAKKTQPLIKLK